MTVMNCLHHRRCIQRYASQFRKSFSLCHTRRKLQDFHLCDQYAADSVGKCIADVTKSPSPLIVYQLDFTLIKALQCHRFDNLFIYEGRKAFIHETEVFCHQNVGRCFVFPDHPYEFPKSSQPISSILPASASWQDEYPVSLVGVFTPSAVDYMLVPGVIHSLTANTGLFSRGRVPHYVLCSGFDKTVMTDINLIFKHLRGSPCWKTFLFHTLFEVNELCQVPASAFSSKIPTQRKTLPYDKENFYLMKLLPRSDLFEKYGNVEELSDLIFTAKHLIKYREKRLIPLLELWFPGIGRELILNGYTMNDKVKHLNFLKYPELFKILQSHPEYSQSPFKLILASPKPNQVEMDQVVISG